MSFGELISTTLVSGYLNSLGIRNTWIDVRQVIRTDNNYREGIVDFNTTCTLVNKTLRPLLQDPKSMVITQGFIAGTETGATTTLGREGSDYSASILSYCLNAESMTIWKDVPGFLNADPKFFKEIVKINKIPFNEAIELAYYGASVIHPKTVKPIQNKGIKLNIKSFVDRTRNTTCFGRLFGALRSYVPDEKVKASVGIYMNANLDTFDKQRINNLVVCDKDMVIRHIELAKRVVNFDYKITKRTNYYVRIKRTFFSHTPPHTRKTKSSTPSWKNIRRCYYENGKENFVAGNSCNCSIADFS